MGRLGFDDDFAGAVAVGPLYPSSISFLGRITSWKNNVNLT
jgi:hypothetical protein